MESAQSEQNKISKAKAAPTPQPHHVTFTRNLTVWSVSQPKQKS